MLLYQYLDLLPQIPEELLQDPIPHYGPDNIGYTDGGSNYEATYTRWGINQALTEWLRDNIINNVAIAGIQIMSWGNEVPPGRRKVNPHCDKRKWALNYIYETGGDAVTTSFYCERGHKTIRAPGTRLQDFSKLDKIDSIVLEPRRWHVLNTNVLHGVTNVETTRKAVTVGINIPNPLEAINYYK